MTRVKKWLPYSLAKNGPRHAQDGALQANGQALAPGQPRPQLAPVFTGPLDAQYFAALRDIFPAAKALSDADLLAATQAAWQGMHDDPKDGR
jgi:hypothetical protein